MLNRCVSSIPLAGRCDMVTSLQAESSNMLSSHSEILNDKKPAVFRYSHSLVENQPLVGGSMLFAVFNDVYSHKFETPAVLAASALNLYMSLDLLLT